MSTEICHNGQFIPYEEAFISPANRSFRYGDGLFETIRLHNGRLLLIDDHLERLRAGMYTLGLDTKAFQPARLRDEALELARRNGLAHARIRIIVFREEGGAYRPLSDRFGYIILTDPLDETAFTLNKKGYRIGLYTETRKPLNSFSGIKSANALLYVMAARYARDNNWDEALILNEQGRICEATAFSLFVVLPDKKIVTPALSEGPLPGVMRKHVIGLLRNHDYVVEERHVLSDELFRAEEIFLTNAVQGIRWVLSFRERRYYNTVAKKLVQGVNEGV